MVSLNKKSVDEKQRKFSDIEVLFNPKNIKRLLILIAPFAFLAFRILLDVSETAALILLSICFIILVRYCSSFIGRFLTPFIPLFWVAPHTPLFLAVLFLYCCLLAYVNRVKFKYSWLETTVFIAFFLFCAVVMKSLVDCNVVDEKEVVKGTLLYGTID